MTYHTAYKIAKLVPNDPELPNLKQNVPLLDMLIYIHIIWHKKQKSRLKRSVKKHVMLSVVEGRRWSLPAFDLQQFVI